MEQISRQAHNPLHKPNSPPDEPCSLCASLVGSADVLARDFGRHRWAQQWFDRKATHFKNKAWPPEARSRLFHSECPTCPSTCAGPLCMVCRHLRLMHIVRCYLGAYLSEDTSHPRCLQFQLGTVGELRRRSLDCEMCHMLVQPVYLDRKIEPDFTVDLFVFLDIRFLGPKYRVVIDLVIDREVIGSGYSKDSYCHTWTGVVGGLGDKELELATQPSDAKSISWNNVVRWLQECDSEHETCCERGHLQHQPSEFRLIDTQRGCVVKAPSACHYATLSYVWGKSSEADLEATTQNIKDLEEEGSLLGANVPATIRDAITACRGLGICYLWVDRVCILQDDDTGKSALINAMGDIYRHSYVTLVTLGDSIHEGLSGVSRSRKFVSKGCKINGMHFIKLDDSYHVIMQQSKWASRGWTFQEALLSRRLLIFSNQGIFLECSKRVETDRRKELSDGEDLVLGEFLPPHEDYREQVEAYTKRELTFQSDILRAFSGILHTIFGSEYYFGLPFSGFYVALLWRTKSGQYLPRDERQQDTFPSWSWAAIQGEVELLYPKFGAISRLKDHFAGPLALWAVPDPDTGKPRIIRYQSGGSGPSVLTMSSTLLSAVMAYKAGCYPGIIHPKLETDRTWKQYEELLHKIWPSYHDFFNDALGLSYLNSSQHDILISHISERFERIGKAGKAYIYTQSLRVRVVSSHKSHGGYSPDGAMELQTELGGSIGWLLPRTIAHKKLFDLQNASPEVFFDALALSLGAIRLTGFDGNEINKVCCYDCEGVPMNFQSHPFGSVVDLMIVETRNGVSRRIALGRTFLTIWVNTSPKFQSFILV